MIERHQDYILTIPSLPSGGSALSIPLQLDTDAPFMLRGRGIHIVPPSTTRLQTDVTQMRFRYRNQAGTYLAQQALQTPQDFWNAFGQNGLYRPVWPQQPYPPGGVISVDLYNDSPDNLTNVQVIFRGVKLFRDGSIPSPTYPQNCQCLNFDYQSGKGTPTDGTLILATTDNLRNIPFQVQNDADFVLRGLQAGLWTLSGSGLYSPFGYTELYIQLFDSQLKPYSNAPIHIDWLFGNANGGTGESVYSLLGNAAPGLPVPEIYIPKNSALFFNLFRHDAAYVGITDALPVRLSLAWIGSKVYPQ